jgi:arginase
MDVSLIYVPYDLDEYRVGMGLAPEAMKEAGLLEHLHSEKIWVIEEMEAPANLGEEERMKRLEKLEKAVSDLVVHACEKQTLPVIIGGDCLSAIGVCAGLLRHLGQEEFGIAWFDAHGDFNTPETTMSGYLGGMPLASVCGYGLENLRQDAGLEKPVDAAHVMLLAVRDLDAPEKELLNSTAITCLSPGDLAAGKTGYAASVHFGSINGVYLHLDIDCLDSQYAPGVSYKTPNGISPQHVVAAVNSIRQYSPLVALTLTAINPALDQEGKTVQTGIDLLVEILSLP